MEGDPKVDRLMRPVRAAIERHVKDRDAVTEIYNRAYEAVMQCMDENAESILAHENDKAYWINREHGMQAEVARLTTALADANADAGRLAEDAIRMYEVDAGDGHITNMFDCKFCGDFAPYEAGNIEHAKTCAYALHRARAGGG